MKIVVLITGLEVRRFERRLKINWIVWLACCRVHRAEWHGISGIVPRLDSASSERSAERVGLRCSRGVAQASVRCFRVSLRSPTVRFR